MTETIDLGPSEELPTTSTLQLGDWNLITVHRTDDPLFRWWGNLNSSLMSKLILSHEDKPKAWKVKLFDFAQNEYEKYGTYYRVLDNSFGEAFDDDIYEVR